MTSGKRNYKHPIHRTKNLKRGIPSLLLAVSMLSLPVQGAMAQSWTSDEVETAYKTGIFERNLYGSPDASITREQFIDLVIKSLEMSGQAFKPILSVPFSDIAEDEPFRASIAKAYASGIVEGYPGGIFRPGQPITKEEAAMVIGRALQLPDQAEAFDDVPDISLFAGKIGSAVEAGLLKGESDGSFGPEKPISIDEAAAIALRMYNTLPFVLLDATIPELHAAMEAGKITSQGLVQQYLDRIEAYDDQGPKLNSILTINPNALQEASSLDKERKQHGARGPLHGIPIILKDNYNTKDMPTTGSSAALDGFIPQEDAFVVEKLRAAGAIIIAKANMHEMAMSGTTVSSLGGQTLNPYDLTRTPGGSSGGTGASVTANFAAAGTGSDTVNSVRSPSSANNLVGIRPTKGLVSLNGILPVSFTQDAAGPITRTVEDAAILLDAMAGFDEKDPATLAGKEHIPATYTDFLDEEGLKGARIGVLQNFFGTEPVHEEVNRVTDEAMVEMQNLGATLVPITIPGMDTNKLISDMDVQKYEIKEELNRYFSAYNTPVTSLEELISKGLFDKTIQSSLESAQAIDTPLEQPDYLERLKKIEDLQQQILKIMTDHDLDVLLYPHQKRLVVPIGESQADRNGILGALTGFPAITFQGGFSAPTETAPIGVPVGIEFLGKPFSETTLIKLAYAFEKGTDHRQAPASTPELK